MSPYLAKADSLGDATLSSLDARFPLVKKPTGELYAEGRAFVTLPLRKTVEGKEYVQGVFWAEKKQYEQEGVVGYGRAVVGTGVVVGGEAYKWVSGYLVPAKKATGGEKA